ncbi:MAG: hypothetical protein IKH61_00410 [Bacteroidales bacterium]|nr:hypothetical protein [Bacteroidales bacterium]
MKVNTLQLKRALSAALFILLLSVAGMKNALAQNQVAVLQHNDTVTAFYGINAFQQAHAAAVNGDTITLSSGDFNACDITKAITLHGAGMVSDTLGVICTRIMNGFTIDISNNTEFFTVEGISFNGNVNVVGNDLHHAFFIKCYFPGFSCLAWNGYSLHDVLFYDCLINNCQIKSAADGVVFYNCVLNSFYNYAVSSSPTVFVYNSIIMPTTTNQSYLNLYNCVIGSNASHIQSQYADHCIVIGDTFPSTVSAYNCMTVNSYSDVFETWDGTFSIDADYSLKGEIATTFLGHDGTQVGIFGGLMPFSFRPSYMRPYRCYVPGFTTTDGHLNVEVEVAPEE